MNQRHQQRSRDNSTSSKDKPAKERSGNRNYRRRRRSNNKNRDQNKVQNEPTEPVHKHIPKRYGVVFYDTLNAAKEDGTALLEKAKEVDQLNIVIRAEAPMDDPELLQYGKIYAGTAWALIHDRRVEEGWYNEPH